MDGQINTSYEFGPFRLIPAERQLLRDGESVTLPPKAFDTLVALVQNSGHALKKDDLLKQVWPDSFVEESNLNHNISVIRKALGDGKNGDGYVETVRGFGFRFNADVRAIAATDSAVLVHRRTRTQVVVKEQRTETQKSTLVEQTVVHRMSRWPLASMLALMVAGLGVSVWYVFLRPPANPNPPVAPVIRSVAVLPFKPLGLDKSEDYLGLSMADSLITKLGKIHNVDVRPTSAIQKYTDEARDPLAIGRELKVDAVLDGRIQKSGERLRITIQLLPVNGGTPVWTEDFDGRLADIFNVQDLISARVARAVAPNLTDEEIARLEKRGTENTEAFQAYLKGRYFWNKRTLEGLKKAIENFQRAIDLSPGYAAAHGGLADSYNLLSEYEGGSPRDSFAAAKRASQKALELDDSLAQAHASLAYVLINHEWDWAEGEKQFKRAIELNPSYATAHQWYAEYLGYMGRLDEAQVEFARALEIDPLSLIINAEQGLPFLVPGKYDQAIDRFRKALELDANFPVTHVYLSIAYELNGQHEQAFAEMLTARRLGGASANVLAAMQQAYECCGLRGVWRDDLVRQTALRRKGYFSPYIIAQTHARLGEGERALTWLEVAYKERDRYIIGLRQDQVFATFRSNPRFQDVLRRMKHS